jgi:hypothetical protein
MVYFSLATLGYGDILPSSRFTQMLAVLEAVIGQAGPPDASVEMASMVVDEAAGRLAVCPRSTGLGVRF